MLAWCNEGPHWHRENYDSGTHGRDECCPRIFDATDGLVNRICDWVRHFPPFSQFPSEFPQSFNWWCLIPAARSLATYLLPSFLGRLSILPAMPGGCYFHMPFNHRCGILSGRGLLLPVLEKGSALTAPRHWIRGFRRSFSGRVPTLILLTEKLVIVRIQIQYQMNRTNRFHCALSSRSQSSFLLPTTPCSRSLTL